MNALSLLPLLLMLSACEHESDALQASHPEPLSTRFYSGCAQPGEFLKLDGLPVIPASFDEDVR
ncbi:MAG: hypothetical protein KME20_12700 [Kaiparowitsia implicata GSE-PSE-MK54-09C]|jgi:hypothetical protein|nr:hypothetical protein [Kaiparowitsia implicata GSE-PSE-MK54-09C]